MELLSAFTSPWELRVVAGTKEIGTVSPLAVALRDVAGANRPLLLAGRSWRVEAIAWDRREIYVREVAAKGSVRWEGGVLAESFEMCRAQRDVLLGANPPVVLSRRATARLASLREDEASTVDADGLVLTDRGDDRRRLWTWAGLGANETVVAGLHAVGVDVREAECDNRYVELPADIGVRAIPSADVARALPTVTPDAVAGLKFSAALPTEMAVATLAERFVDREGAADVVSRAIVVRTEWEDA
jgi:ATP-dependent Lhr-like helicase